LVTVWVTRCARAPQTPPLLLTRQVIQIEGALKSAAVSRPDLATLLRRVQDTERQKLRLTLSW
jgi:hypothetical protein